jgi:hypothetical protein
MTWLDVILDRSLRRRKAHAKIAVVPICAEDDRRNDDAPRTQE